MPGISIDFTAPKKSAFSSDPKGKYKGDSQATCSYNQLTTNLGVPTISLGSSLVALVVKEPACQCGRCKRCRFNSWVKKIPWRRAQQPTPVILPGKSHGQRSLTGYSSWGCKGVGHNLVTKQQQELRVGIYANKF